MMELEAKVAASEERMETRQARYEGALDRLRADLAKRDGERDAEFARRETRMLLAIAGMFGLAVTILLDF